LTEPWRRKVNSQDNASSQSVPAIPNGTGAAAMLAAAVGCFALGVLAFAGDKSVAIKNSLNFYKPTGPLSGVTISAIVIWFAIWGILEWRWGRKTVALGRVNTIALVLLGLSLLLTFPPVVDLL
jgi:hypothetical protein